MSFWELVQRLMKKRGRKKRGMSKESARRLAGWIESHGSGVISSPRRKRKGREKANR